jgi:hypothetical protein
MGFYLWLSSCACSAACEGNGVNKSGQRLASAPVPMCRIRLVANPKTVLLTTDCRHGSERSASYGLNGAGVGGRAPATANFWVARYPE